MHACLHVEVEVAFGLFFGDDVFFFAVVVVPVFWEGKNHLLFLLFYRFGVLVGWSLDDGTRFGEGFFVEVA